MLPLTNDVNLNWGLMENQNNIYSARLELASMAAYSSSGSSSSGSSSSNNSGTRTVDPRDNRTANVTISMSDYDTNSASHVTVVGTAGNDKFSNLTSNVTIFGGAGDDTIDNRGDYVSISGGAGDDSIRSADLDSVMGTTIYGGKGDDTIALTYPTFSSTGDNIVQYANGDGNDYITGWNKADTLYIEGSYTSSKINSNLVVNVGSGSITIKNWGNESSSEVTIVTVPAGTFSSTTEPVAPSVSTTTTNTVTANTATTNTATTNTAMTNTASPATISTAASSSTTTTTGGNQVVSNYAGQAVTFSGNFTGASFSGNNFVVNSSTGTTTIQNVTDKVVDLRDGAGNAFIKAYTPSAADPIDGRGIAGYEIIYGSAAGTDVIFAGDGGSQLWGGNDTAADALVGGNGADIFIGGRFQGSDNFYNVSSTDAISLTDTSLSDIIAAVESGGTIAIAFNTGNTITIQSTELLSAAINLADNSSWRYNHVTKSWQGE